MCAAYVVWLCFDNKAAMRNYTIVCAAPLFDDLYIFIIFSQ